MKKLIILLVLMNVLGCGGSEGDIVSQDGDDVAAAESPVSDPPIITAINGNGTSDDLFEDALIITGDNFTSDMTVDLVSKTETQTFQLDYTLNSKAEIVASLPEALTVGDYEITITSAVGTAVAAVTILRGETGSTGPQGVQGPQGSAGLPGISIAAEFSCGASSDIDNTSNSRTGQHAYVFEYSDGSYFMSCMVDYLNSTFLYVDTSSYISWFASDSVGVATGTISCTPFYVTAEYSIPNNAVTYSNQGDASQRQTISCTQVYP